MDICPLVISHILAEFHPERATYTTLHNHFSLMDYPHSAQTFTDGFVKFYSLNPHCCLGKLPVEAGIPILRV